MARELPLETLDQDSRLRTPPGSIIRVSVIVQLQNPSGVGGTGGGGAVVPVCHHIQVLNEVEESAEWSEIADLVADRSFVSLANVAVWNVIWVERANGAFQILTTLVEGDVVDVIWVDLLWSSAGGSDHRELIVFCRRLHCCCRGFARMEKQNADRVSEVPVLRPIYHSRWQRERE